ncbi:MAG TPA: hypothetical protein VI488_07625 [Candidatus Angelobacter sp.]
MKFSIRPWLALIAASVLLAPTPSMAAGNVPARSQSRQSVNRNTNAGGNTNVNRNANVNRNTNVNTNTNVNRNTNVNVDRNVNVHGGYYGGSYGGGCCYHPVATAAAVTATAVATAAVVGSRVQTLPPSCTVVVAGGVSYQQCGSTWYQPQIASGSTTYVVVNPPQ